jgi:ATPase subunit of ABC transporter with duplicated ATPase domains
LSSYEKRREEKRREEKRREEKRREEKRREEKRREEKRREEKRREVREGERRDNKYDEKNKDPKSPTLRFLSRTPPNRRHIFITFLLSHIHQHHHTLTILTTSICHLIPFKSKCFTFLMITWQ